MRDRMRLIRIPRHIQGTNELRFVADELLCLVPDPRQADKEAKDELSFLLESIPESHRKAIILVHIEGFTQVDAAKKLKVHVTTVARWLREGLSAMRRTAA